MNDNSYPPIPENTKVSEFSLRSIGPPPENFTRNIMKVQSQKFNLANLKPPVRVIRKNKLNEVEQAREKEELLAAAAKGNVEKMMAINPDLVSEILPAIQPTGSSGETKFEPAKLMAQLHNQFKKKEAPFKPKRKFRVLHSIEDGPTKDGDAPILKLPDPDKHPYVLTHSDASEQNTYIGNVDGSTSNSQYMLFVLRDDHFDVMPVQKFYKFTQKPQYKTLGIDDVEKRMSKKGNNTVPVWLMRDLVKDEVKDENEPVTREVKVKDEDDEDGVKSKSLLTQLRKDSLNSALEMKVPKAKRGSKREEEIDEEMDFEEEFDDDEELNLGLEDDEEKKEAERRVYGRAGKKAFLEEEEDAEFDDLLEREISGSGKSIKKYRRKMMKITNEFDPDVSDDDEEEEEESDKEKEKDKSLPLQKQNPPGFPFQQQPSQQMFPQQVPQIMRSPFPPMGPPGAQHQFSMQMMPPPQQLPAHFGQHVSMMPPPNMPMNLPMMRPPMNPTLNQTPVKNEAQVKIKLEPNAQILVEKEKEPMAKKRRVDSGSVDGDVVVRKQITDGEEPKNVEASPAPSSVSSSTDVSSGRLLTEQDIIDVYHQMEAEGKVPKVPLLIGQLKKQIEAHPLNRELVKNLIKKCMSYDKQSGTMKLKK